MESGVILKFAARSRIRLQVSDATGYCVNRHAMPGFRHCQRRASALIAPTGQARRRSRGELRQRK